MKFKLIAASAALAMLTGCAADGKVSDKSYLRAAAIDGNVVTLSFFSDEDENITVAANDLSQAKTAAELRAGKEVFTGYTELIVLGDDNNADTLSFILKEWKVSPECIIAGSSISGETLLSERPPEELEGAVRSAQKHGLAGKCDIVTVLGRLLQNGSAEVPELSREGFCGTSEIRSETAAE